MIDLTGHILIILPSLILANVLHMLIVKYNFIPILNKPIATEYFGNNKTWRGFLLLPLLNSLLLLFLNSVYNWHITNPAAMGFILGLAYVLFELPNSFFKRKQGIKPGESSSNNHYFFMLLDKIDSAFGVALVYYLLANITLSGAVLLLLINSLTHIVLSLFLVFLKIKSSF